MHRAVTMRDARPGRAALPDDTHIGAVALTVADLAGTASFYESVLGFAAVYEDDGRVMLSAAGGPTLVELHGDSSAPARDPRSPGLFHMAVLMPDRAHLAMALARLAAAGWSLSGASDHLVSEALYLSDPEGNGIEIYRDRPRDEWPVRDGSVAMATLPLDLENLLTELGGSRHVERQAPDGTTMGHVHLQVSDLSQAEDFYAGVLGFDLMVRGYPGALFVSAAGYHHHVGLNTWNSAGSGPAPADATGLRSFEVVLPGPQEVEQVLSRVKSAGSEIQPDSRGYLIRDPFGNRVLLRSA